MSSSDSTGSYSGPELELDSSVSSISSGHLEAYKKAFRKVDDDHNGELDTKEIQEALSKVGVEVSGAELQQVMDEIDTNGDGVVSFSEFCQMERSIDKERSLAVHVAFKVLADKESHMITTDSLAHKLSKMHAPFKTDDIGDEFPSDESEIDEPTFRSLIGYDHLPDNTTSSTDTSYSSDEEASAGYDKDTIPVDCVPLTIPDTVYTVEVDPNATLRRLAEDLSSVAEHPAHLLRLYNQGSPLSDYSKTVKEAGIKQKDRLLFSFIPRVGHADSDDVWEGDEEPDVDFIWKWFEREGRLSKADALKIVETAQGIFDDEPNIHEVDAPCTVVTDIHGQFYDLRTIINQGGTIGEDTYLFLGDYGDRGYFSYEVLLFLLAAKIKYPDKMKLCRGNHEHSNINARYGTQAEGWVKYDKEVHDALTEMYLHMPFAAVVSVPAGGKKKGKKTSKKKGKKKADVDDGNDGVHRFYCMHGGLSKHLVSIADLKEADRRVRPPKGDPLYDVLWTDPDGDCERPNGGRTKHSESAASLTFDIANLKKKKKVKEVTRATAQKAFSHTDKARYFYQNDALNYYLQENNLTGIIRGHQTCVDGVYLYKTGYEYDFPACICIFSAPNYMDATTHLGAVCHFNSKGKMEIKRYKGVPHPVYHFAFSDSKAAFVKDFFSEDVLQFAIAKNADVLSEMKLSDTIAAYRRQYGSGRYPSEYATIEKKTLSQMAHQVKKVKALHDSSASEVSSHADASDSEVATDDFGGALNGGVKRGELGYYGMAFPDLSATLSGSMSDADDASGGKGLWQYIKTNIPHVLKISKRPEAAELYEKNVSAMYKFHESIDDFAVFADTEEISDED